jgi:hypothetical protein
MTDLLDLALEARGGFDKWKGVTGVDLRLTLGGYLFEIKQHPDGLRTALVTWRVLRAYFPGSIETVLQRGSALQTTWSRTAFVCQPNGAPTRAAPIVGRSGKCSWFQSTSAM